MDRSLLVCVVVAAGEVVYVVDNGEVRGRRYKDVEKIMKKEEEW